MTSGQRPSDRRSPPRISDPCVAGTGAERLLTCREAATFLRLSESWLSKARMRGDGPPYEKFGRSIRYSEGALLEWRRSRQRLSTREG
jgi:predicted DNA-binding transcriptional regulator AlpA